MVILGLVNLEFHRFYGTPISPVIFGLMQDDTGAIVTQILRDWPVARYALLLAALIALAMRRTLDTFPLRQQHLGVSPHAFINQCVQNGAFSLYEAWKGQKALDFSDGELAEVKRLGFRGIDEVDAVLQERRSDRSSRRWNHGNGYIRVIVSIPVQGNGIPIQRRAASIATNNVAERNVSASGHSGGRGHRGKEDRIAAHKNTPFTKTGGAFAPPYSCPAGAMLRCYRSRSHSSQTEARCRTRKGSRAERRTWRSGASAG